MSAFRFISPEGGAINFRGLNADLVAISESSGKSVDVLLDSSSTAEGNRFIAQCSGGVLDPITSARRAYNQAQFFFTRSLQAGRRTVSSKGVYDEYGAAIKEPAQKTAALGFELRMRAQDSGAPIWIGWIAIEKGKWRLKVKGDNKTLASALVDIEARSQEAVRADVEAGTLLVDSHMAAAAKAAVAGDLIVFSFELETIDAVKVVELSVE